MKQEWKGVAGGLAALLLAGCSATQAAEPAGQEVALERRISAQLEQDVGVQEQFLSGLRVTGELRCGVELLDARPDGTRFVAVLCGDFVAGRGMDRGGVAPAVVGVRGSGRVTSVRFVRARALPATAREAWDDGVVTVPSQAELSGWG